jgi:hypothetical protein
MKLKCSVLVTVFILFGGLGGAVRPTAAAIEPGVSSVCASHFSADSTQHGLDSKAARALLAQQEHTKVMAAGAVSDFEKSLLKGNLLDCERRVSTSAELWSNGERVNTCGDLLDQRHRANDAEGEKAKLKFRNQLVELTYPEARVTLDVLPSREHHVYLLEQVRYRWVIMCFASFPEK